LVVAVAMLLTAGLSAAVSAMAIDRGSQGAAGDRGPKGYRGPAATVGDPGPRGPRGFRGAPRGPRGLRGPRGKVNKQAVLNAIRKRKDIDDVRGRVLDKLCSAMSSSESQTITDLAFYGCR
jgi:Collagen triple helix repeat (20 copies)